MVRPVNTSTATPRNASPRVLDVASALARFGLAFMWIYSGMQKVLEPHINVTKTIEAYEIFTPYWSDLLAQAIGPLEVAGGLILLLGIKIRWAGGVSLGVLVVFILGLYSAHARGLVIDCGCFDPAEADPQPGGLLTAIWRDVFLVAVTAFMMWRPYKKFALYP